MANARRFILQWTVVGPVTCSARGRLLDGSARGVTLQQTSLRVTRVDAHSQGMQSAGGEEMAGGQGRRRLEVRASPAHPAACATF